MSNSHRKQLVMDKKKNSNNQHGGNTTNIQNIQEEGDTLIFDKERLAGEIDEFFQKSTEACIGTFNKSINAKVKQQETESDKIFKKTEEFIAKNREFLIAEILKTPVAEVMANGISVKIEFTDHPETQNVVESLMMFRKALLVGPTGGGKSTMIYKIAEKLKVPFYKYSCSRDSSVHDFIGYKQPKSEEYLNTSFIQCYENGGIFLVDEYDAATSDMAVFFNGITDNTEFISIPHRDVNPTAIKHKDFYIIFCGNTWGSGGVEYAGRDFQDKALLDRFRMCKHYIGYHTLLEKQLTGTNYGYAMDLRNKLEKIGSYLSTRNIEDMCKLLASGKTREFIAQTIMHDLSELDKEELKKVM